MNNAERRAPSSLLSAMPMGGLFSIIEALHDNVAIVDGDGTMLWVSPCFERTYGLKNEEVVGRTTYELEQNKIFSPSVAALVIKTKRVATVTELNSSGSYNIVTGVPVYDDEGNLAFVVSYTVDPRYSLKLQAEYEKINSLLGSSEELAALPAIIPNFVCASGNMKNVLETIKKLAKVDTSVLITGESGVGKNVLARILHRMSERSEGPLVEINCAGIPDSLLESELFGYETGAFTGANAKGKPGRIELANNGTLFLDEIGELPLPLQAKLLQVLQEKKIVKLGGTNPIDIDFRLVTATNQDLQALVEKKRFRSDLFFRLYVFPITLTPLRERREDILPLADVFLNEMNIKYGTEKVFAQKVKDVFTRHSWPGNVRELRNLVEQLVVISEKRIIGAGDLPSHLRPGEHDIYRGKGSLPEALDALEGHIVREAYGRLGTTVAVARALGISQPSAARKIARHCRRNGPEE